MGLSAHVVVFAWLYACGAVRCVRAHAAACPMLALLPLALPLPVYYYVRPSRSSGSSVARSDGWRENDR